MLRRLQHGGIEEGVRAQQAAIRQREVRVGRFDHQDVERAAVRYP